MPYIKQEDREKYNSLIIELAKKLYHVQTENGVTTYTNVAGHLNYIITTLLLNTYQGKLPSYTIYNEIIGILECAKLELYREQIAPYEDIKIKENGVVNTNLLNTNCEEKNS